MKPGRIGCAPLLALLLASGCGGNAADGRRIGGETNWLVTCNSDSDCGAGQCLCNVCTVSCATDASCSDGPPESRCTAASELAASCGEALSASICLTPEAPASLRLDRDRALDELLATLEQDLLAQPAGDRPFLRYVSGANLKYLDNFIADPAIVQDVVHQRVFQRGLRAVNELANSLSLAPTLGLATVVDQQRQLVRIDLRSYGWDRTIFIDGHQYADGWEAIVANATMAIQVAPLAGPDGATLESQLGTRVPWLFVDDFVAAAALGDTYYDLLGLPHSLLDLQISLAGNGAYRAAFTNSGVSTSPRMVEWQGDTQEPARGYWRTLDFQTAARGEEMFSNPFTYESDSGELIYTLPNGLYGFFLSDGDGRRVTESVLSPEPISDPMQHDSVMRSAISCFSCHNGGLINFRDEMGSHQDPMDISSFYPGTKVLDQLREDANERYVRVIEALGDTDLFATGRRPLSADSVSLIYREFANDGVDLELAAKALLVSPATLRSRLSEMPALARLRSSLGTMSRQEFGSAYRDALCTLHQADETRIGGCTVP